MKRSQPRGLYLMGMLLSMAVIVTAWSLRTYIYAGRELELAVQDLQACVAAAGKIQALARRPQLASSLDRHDRALPALVENAARTAGFAAEQAVDRITADRPRRVGDTPFTELATHMNLRRLNLRQLVSFLDSLCEQDPALGVRNLRLSAPRDQEQSDQWNVEVTLTYLIYTPREEQRP